MVALFILCIFVNVGMWFEPLWNQSSRRWPRAFPLRTGLYSRSRSAECGLIVARSVFLCSSWSSFRVLAGLSDRRDQGDAARVPGGGRRDESAAIQKLLMLFRQSPRGEWDLLFSWMTPPKAVRALQHGRASQPARVLSPIQPPRSSTRSSRDLHRALGPPSWAVRSGHRRLSLCHLPPALPIALVVGGREA